MGNNYQRLFYIFQNFDNNLGNPSGYIKVEINDQTAKLQITLNNLENRPGLNYQLYGISKNDQRFDYTTICDIQNLNGRADMKISLDSSNIGTNHLSFNDINIFAVTAHLPGQYTMLGCPLVTYKKGEIQWKHEFEAALRKQAHQINNLKNSEKNEENKVEAGTAQKKEIKLDTVPTESILINQVQKESSEPEIVEDKAALENKKLQIIFTEDVSEAETEVEETVGNISDLVEVTENKLQDTVAQSLVTSELEAVKQKVDEPAQNILTQKENFNYDMGDITSKFEATLTSIYNNDKLKQSLPSESDLPDVENDIIGSAERNFKEISAINAEGDTVRNELDIDSLKEELDKSFEICNPFNTKSKRFKWWKINSPGYLNNILFRNNVKTYLLFNPKVMVAHYKYRYIIFGLRYDKYSGRERFVCGVPGVYSIDENPFGNMGSWAQLEGYKPKYGAFGYWIILIDPRTGKLLKIK